MEKTLNTTIVYSKKQFTKYCSKEPLETLHKFKIYLDDIYYNTDEAVFPDLLYDILKDTLLSRDPKYIPPVGIQIRKHENRVMIPYFMGSADKITPKEQKKLTRWLNKNKCEKTVISSKLDGVSCLYVRKNGKCKLYTRGDGVEGSDISYLAQYMSSVPKNGSDIVVRGELIMPKKIFDKKYKYTGNNYKKEKGDSKGYGRTYKNSRNMVSGLIGAKTIRQGLSDIDFVAYEQLYDTEYTKCQSEQLKILEKLKFKVVNYSIVDIKNIGIKELTLIHDEFKTKSIYELDGIVVQSDVDYIRETSKSFPPNMFAFKVTDENNIIGTTVKKIEWNISKWGILKPVVIYDPVDIQGVTMTRASAYHAKYVIENNLGIGAKILVTRSKEVIPFIVKITKGVTPILPEIPWEWDSTKTNIKITEYSSETTIKLIANFFSKLNIKFISEATVTKLYNSGLNSLLKIIKATKEELLNVPTIKDKSADRIITNIKKGLTNVELPVLIGASGVLGDSVGRKRVIALFEGIPNILDLYQTVSNKQLIKNINMINGFSVITSTKIVKNLPIAIVFVNDISPYVTYKTPSKNTNGKLSDMKFVMTGFRDKKLEEQIISLGGKMTSSVSKNTEALIVKSKNVKSSGKSKKAEKLGIGIYNVEEFKEKYM